MPNPPPDVIRKSAPSDRRTTALDAARDYAQQALAPATRRAYQSDWADFSAWCAARHWPALPSPPTTVAAYIASLAATHAARTIRRRLVAIGQAHRLAGHDWTASHPAIRATLRGLLRRHGTPPRRAAALATEEIRRLLATCDDGLTGLRDRALLLLGYAAALRRAELVAVEREHLAFTPDGLRLLIPRGKTDPEGQGVELGIPRGTQRDTCPVRALDAWLQASACDYGPVFRKIDTWGSIEHRALHPDAVRQILRRRAAAAGLAAPASERLSPHGLRAGFITEAYRAGARDEQIMSHTRHRDLTTMRGYVRRAKLLTDSPAKLLGLQWSDANAHFGALAESAHKLKLVWSDANAHFGALAESARKLKLVWSDANAHFGALAESARKLKLVWSDANAHFGALAESAHKLKLVS